MRLKIFLFLASVFLFNNNVLASTNISSSITTDTTWALVGSPYILEISPSINSGVTLTIEPGVVVKAKSDKSIKIKGTLVANGTAENPISFTSIKDDSVGGDTNANGAENSPSESDWVGLDFWNTSSGSVLNNIQIKYGDTCLSSDGISLDFLLGET